MADDAPKRVSEEEDEHSPFSVAFRPDEARLLLDVVKGKSLDAALQIVLLDKVRLFLKGRFAYILDDAPAVDEYDEDKKCYVTLFSLPEVQLLEAALQGKSSPGVLQASLIHKLSGFLVNGSAMLSRRDHDEGTVP
jgi:hypothetical protein